MATEGESRVDVDGETVRIHDVMIEDSDTAAFFERRPADEPPEETVRRAITVGVQALKVAETAQEVDYVDKRFKEFHTEVTNSFEEIRSEIDDTFKDDDSAIQRRLDHHLNELEDRLRERLGSDGEFLREALHHESEDSPLYTINEQIQSLRDEVQRAQGRAEERKYSPRKGDDFEDDVAATIQQNLTGPVDDLTRTETEEGDRRRKKKGDIMVTTESGQQMAIEVKDRTADMSKDEIGEYLTKTLENRKADHAMLVMRNADAVPTTKMGWFHEFDRERLCIVLSEGPDADPEWRFLRFGYNWARARAAQLRAADDVDTELIDEELGNIENQLDDFESIRNSARTISEEAQEIVTLANTMERRIDSHFRELKTELGIIDAS